jgi:hypothetical protein
VILAMSGECPNVGFIAAGRAVLTDKSTEFKRGDCHDLSIGDFVKVRGTTTPGSPVSADRIEFKR